jgi:AcrR family transcriptional regulator
MTTPRTATRAAAPASTLAGPPLSRRGEIVAAALELFATRGYGLTTMADIGERVGMRGPSLYKHVGAKQELLAEIMIGTMDVLLDHQRAAIATTADPREQLRRAAEAHARYHARHRYQAFVGNRELNSLEPAGRAQVLDRRSVYEQRLRALIENGRDVGVFRVASARLASYAILDMGMGVSVWFDPRGENTAEEIAYLHGDFALQIVGCASSAPLTAL